MQVDFDLPTQSCKHALANTTSYRASCMENSTSCCSKPMLRAAKDSSRTIVHGSCKKFCSVSISLAGCAVATDAMPASALVEGVHCL